MELVSTWYVYVTFFSKIQRNIRSYEQNPDENQDCFISYIVKNFRKIQWSNLVLVLLECKSMIYSSFKEFDFVDEWTNFCFLFIHLDSERPIQNSEIDSSVETPLNENYDRVIA